MTTRPTSPAPSSNRNSPLRLISAGTATSARGPSLLMLLAFILLVVLTFLGMVWSRTLLDEGAFQLADLQTRIEQETIRNRLLRLEVARLENPDRIASLAEPLGLFYPDEVVHIQVPGLAPREPGLGPPG
ncbi:MAG: hypothetical protein F4Y83_01890 [Acidimicrobiia bacterium]|nr:hypothetical protein [bacterium]MDE0673494.1 hypothetical protein [bacterium]MXY73670.1 hypothetical protein [Acidimicrobiia bacterium]